jgi:hypothetical protein
MNMTHRFFAALSLLVCATANAKTVEGQVFIVTAGGPAIKLALVQVGAIPRAVMEKYLADVEPKINAGRRDAELAADKAVTEWHKMTKVMGERSQRILELIKRKNYLEEEHARQREWEESATRGDDAVAHKKMWNSAAPYFVELPQPIATAKTDAEGRFQMNLPDGDYIVVAKAERTVFKAAEKYYWVVRLAAQDSKVTLSNDNLTTSRSSDSVLTTKE